jgi:hypothetical protein
VTSRTDEAPAPPVDPAPPRARRPIVAAPLRPFALVLAVLAAGALAGLSIAFAGDRRGTSLDDSLARRMFTGFGSTLRAFTLHTSDQHLTASLLVVIVVGALLFRRWDIAVFATASPLLAIFLTEVVLKPVVGRYLSYEFVGLALPHSGAFPSGHETGLAALTVELAVLVLRAPIAAVWRALAVVLLAVWTAVGAVGLAANLYHYATDCVGGVLVSLAVVLGVALVVDALWSRFSSPDARSRPRTSRAA